MATRLLHHRRNLFIGAFCLFGAFHAKASPVDSDFFEKKIRPVLAEKCYGCHNGAMKSPLGGLRLDSREGLAQGGKSGAVLVAGDPENSRLLHALSYKHSLKMPPSGKLPDSEIADFATWIKSGTADPRESGPPLRNAGSFAEAKKFWAFQPVQASPLPRVKHPKWIQSPVDAWVLSKLENNGLQPAEPADKRALLRRVTFDLTGLPPSAEEIDAFLKDNGPNAFRTVVDRLLASPQYGERWARHWLDLVRYAETNGHEFDNDKLDPWRYRDYVIRAFNEDVPYNQFVREHLAGDLLPSKRLRADGAAWESPLGTTSLWFNEILNSATDSEKSRADNVDNQIDVTGKAFLGLTVACARCHDHKFDPIPTADYYALAGVFHSTNLREAVIDSPAVVKRLRDLSVQMQRINQKMETIAPDVAVAPAIIHYRPEDKVFERFNAPAFGSWETEGVAFGDGTIRGTADSRAAGSDRFVGTLISPKFKTGKELFLHVRIGGTKADPKWKERGALRFSIVVDGYKGQHIVADGSDTPQWKTLQLTLERERTCYFEIVDRSRDGHIIIDEIVFSESKDPPKTEQPTFVEAVNKVADPEAEKKLQMLRAEKAQLETQLPESEFAMVAEDRDCRDVRVHVRGSHKNLGEEVPRRFLQVVAGEKQPPIRSGSGRLQIAEWTASAGNPLTARVMVNRIWQHHFGSGIVRSADNFGHTGEPPTHPELLDYLASQFVESGWSVKAMHRLMLLSSTYQMGNKGSETAAKSDPTNRLLQHMPARRLEAEAIRDSILAVSGSLDRKMFGPSVPPFISEWQNGRGKPTSGPLDGAGRRSIYVQVRRNFLTPLFLAFDYPVPISAIGARTVSTVPSQALMMMNNSFVSQQAAKWAVKAVAEAADPVERVQRMYLSAFARPANVDEVASVLSFVKGESSRTEAAVWADVAHVLINSAEFIYLR